MTPASCPSCGSTLSPGAAQGLCPRCLLAGAAAPTEPSPSRPAPPTMEEVAAAFPQFEIVSLIGQGGMGAVYQVRQPKLDRFAALKLLPETLAADPAFAGRFEREARLLAKLSHPGVVSIYDYGQAGAYFFLLMEFVDGVNLRQAMRAGRFTASQALSLVPRICEALQYAHDEGVLHRDIKPENILLDSKGRVKLADFGIAKLRAEPDAEPSAHPVSSPGLTQAGAALGTPAYMAPEQRDTPSAVDHRADIYSLGVVFHELLTGELPSGAIVSPAAKCAADPRVDEIVRQALQRERELRQNSAAEMRTQVETVTSTPPPSFPPVEPAPISPPRPDPRFSRTAIAGAIWAVLFPLVLVLWLWKMKPVAVHPGQPLPGPAWWQMALAIVTIPLGLAAPFGTTILGWVSVSQIRRSAGRLHGLWLGVADGLLFPLLLLDGLIIWLIRKTGEGFLDWPSRLTSAQTAQWLVVSIALCLTVDFVIIRTVWRSLTGKSTTLETTKVPLGPTLALQAALLGIFCLLTITVVPHYEELYKTFAGKLPEGTALIIETVKTWKGFLFPVLLGVDALICLMIRDLWGKRGLRLWNIVTPLALVLAIGLMSFALMKPLQAITEHHGDSPQAAHRKENSASANPESATVALSYQSLQSEAKALISSHFPKAVGNEIGDETTFTLNLRDYEVHNGSKTGSVAQQTTRETGPAAIGFRLTIQRLKAPLVSQAVLPQFLDRPYWKSYANAYFDATTGEGIAVYYDYGSALPPAFQEAMLEMLQLRP